MTIKNDVFGSLTIIENNGHEYWYYPGTLSGFTVYRWTGEVYVLIAKFKIQPK